MSRVYEVPEISCSHCKQTIETVVSALDGVRRVEVDVPARTVLVEGDAPEVAVRDVLADAGYDVASVSEESPA